MPTYEYRCNDCKTKFEVSGSFQTLFSLKPVCPKCRKNNCKKIINVPFVHYNDDGFTKYIKEDK